MNLSARKLGLGVILLTSVLLTSCEKSGEFGIGDDAISPIEFFTEQISISSSVVMVDSIRTDNSVSLLVGQITDSDFGTSVGKVFNKLNLNKGALPDITSDAVLDSVQINLNFNYIHEGQNDKLDLTVGFLPVNSIYDTALYFANSPSPNTTGSLLDPNITELGRQTYTIGNLESSYVMNVNSDWSQRVFQLLKDNDEAVADQAAFEENVLPGLAFFPGDNTTGIFGIQSVDSTNMVFYWHQSVSGVPDPVNFTHTMSLDNAKKFYVIEADRTGSGTQEVQDVNVSYEPASGLRYVQETTGIVTKLNISAFKDFTTNNPDVVINSAELTIGPLEDRLPQDGPPPQVISFYLTDERNTPISDGTSFRSIQFDGSSQIGSGAPITVVYNSDNNIYTTSVTSFLQSLHDGAFERNEFFIYPIRSGFGLNSFVIDPSNIRLKIFYSALK